MNCFDNNNDDFEMGEKTYKNELSQWTKYQGALNVHHLMTFKAINNVINFISYVADLVILIFLL